ncbi:MAG: PilZ domain-containing protein [Endomicrobiales bacterium]|nr:PilZ domain-containing protein [Endomicrobiales bacterium]
MGKNFDGLEKRKYVRLAKPILVNFRILNKKSKEVIINWRDGLSKDISKGGLRIEIYDPNPKFKKIISDPDNVLELNIPLYFQRKATLKGEVEYVHVTGESVWNRKAWDAKEKAETLEIGIAFKRSDNEIDSLITAFITDNLGKK